jgi:hypothetical protein
VAQSGEQVVGVGLQSCCKSSGQQTFDIRCEIAAYVPLSPHMGSVAGGGGGGTVAGGGGGAGGVTTGGGGGGALQTSKKACKS